MKDKVINDLLKRIADLEFEVERLEKVINELEKELDRGYLDLFEHELVDYGCNITFITGRLHFNDSNSAPFPSCLIRLTGNGTECRWLDRSSYE